LVVVVQVALAPPCRSDRVLVVAALVDIDNPLVFLYLVDKYGQLLLVLVALMAHQRVVLLVLMAQTQAFL
jgi:hypothetical protein